MPQLMVSFRGLEAPQWVLDGLRAGDIAALCLFAYNIESPAQLRALTETLRAATREGWHPPPLIGVDQEGGQLQAVGGGATELPGNMALGAAGRADLAERAGRLLGRELLAMGCTMDFAPVLDLSQRPENPVIGIRSFGDDPHRVAGLGAALVRGMQATGLLATAKHFPGHGDTSADSHHATPRIDRSRSQLEAVELVPFRRAIEAGVAAIMTAHAAYPPIDHHPATLSQRLLRGVLREELGYDGLIVTDAMDMAPVAHLDPEARVAAALDAGADLVLLGHLEGQAELVAAMRTRWDRTATARIDRARRTLPDDLPEPGVVGCDEHLALAQEIADAAVTIVRGEGLPLRFPSDTEIAVVTVQSGNLTPADTSGSARVRLAEQIRLRHPNVREIDVRRGAATADLASVVAAARGAYRVVVGAVDAVTDPSQVALLRALADAGAAPVLISLRTPFDAAAAPWLETHLCAYGARAVNTEAAARALFGEIEANGRLPVTLTLGGRPAPTLRGGSSPDAEPRGSQHRGS